MSLRARLLAGMAVIAIVLAVAAVAIAHTTREHLISQVDTQLASTRASSFVGQQEGGPDPDAQASEVYAVLIRPDGSVLSLSTPNLFHENPPLPELTVDQIRSGAQTDEPFTVNSTGDTDLRYRVLARGGRNGLFVVALPLADVDDAIARLITVEILATVTILGVLALVSWWVIRLGVRPIKQMTATAAAIAGGSLSHRVPDVTPGTEAGDLGVALNQMLGRIEYAFDQQTQSENRLRQFVADASHELRTPVTIVRGYAELYRDGGLADSGELEEAMRRTEQEAIRMGTLVDDLLLLARLDQGRPLERRPVELAALAEDAVRDARAVDPDRPITVSTNGPVTVIGDEARLRQVVANLVGNALVHTPPGTPVDVRVSADTTRAVLEVTDQGPGMSDDVAARAFERFYRADPSRSRHAGGTGLGLAIVQATVAAHAGSVALDTAPGRGTTVHVELPMAPTDSA